MRQHRINPGARAGDGAVDPFRREQDGAVNAGIFRDIAQRRLALLKVGQGGEFIKRGDNNL